MGIWRWTEREEKKDKMLGFLQAALAAYIMGDLEGMKSMMNEAAILYEKWRSL
jgi:hypothetical protein